MENVTSKQVKEIRDKYGIGIMEAKRMVELENLTKAIADMNIGWGQEIKDILLKMAELIK